MPGLENLSCAAVGLMVALPDVTVKPTQTPPIGLLLASLICTVSVCGKALLTVAALIIAVQDGHGADHRLVGQREGHDAGSSERAVTCTGPGCRPKATLALTCPLDPEVLTIFFRVAEPCVTFHVTCPPVTGYPQASVIMARSGNCKVLPAGPL